jgi:hypothetical protein
MTYGVYLDLVRDLLTENKTTGPNQGDDLVEYTRLNLQRMERINKTLEVNPELAARVKAINQKQTWLCITEAWCGDAAQNLPLFQRLADMNPLITFKLVLRDENLELMDKYLTNGGRAIPVVIGIRDGNEIWKWGPRPKDAQEMINAFKQYPDKTFEELKTALHTWYAKNKTHDQQQELITILES